MLHSGQRVWTSMSSFGLYLAVAQYLHQSCSLGKPLVGGWAFHLHPCLPKQVWLSLYPPPLLQRQRAEQIRKGPATASFRTVLHDRAVIGHSKVRSHFFLMSGFKLQLQHCKEALKQHAFCFLTYGGLGQDFLTRLPILWLCENCRLREADVFTSLNHNVHVKPSFLRII